MKIIEDCYLEKLKKYRAENKKFLENNIVNSFLQVPENQNLFILSVCYPSPENQMKLDEAFKKYYFNIRFTAYISSAIYFNAINFDKRMRKFEIRYPLTVDKTMGTGEEGTFKDLIPDYKAEVCIDHILRSEDIIDYLGNPGLIEAVNFLTVKQKEVLKYAYVKGYSDTKIAQILKKSQQAISKIRKKALQNMKQHLQSREGIYG